MANKRDIRRGDLYVKRFDRHSTYWAFVIKPETGSLYADVSFDRILQVEYSYNEIVVHVHSIAWLRMSPVKRVCRLK